MKKQTESGYVVVKIKNQGAMKVMKHNDDIIRSVKEFKKYNNVMSEIVEETAAWKKPKGFQEKIFCGTFVAKVYIGNTIKGTYRFDCTDFGHNIVSDNARIRLSKVD